ncbi:GRF1-interacting factor 1-like [Gastrolobium bilobum]|uniref:GRF1-interacting factor 1-like n=1 Tax=Gastrolobium bilobum TaxID=150636 RepID=UPI002AB135E4|nr:GRF1-interacting factor 1-like [Gastrolobium bilobum]
MFNGDPPLPSIPNPTTEQIQKYLEENKELILTILEAQNLGKFTEIAQCQAKLQHNLTFLAKLADAGPQAQIHSQGQGMQHTQVAMSQQQPNLSTSNLSLDMIDQHQQHQQQHHLTMSLQQPDLSTSKLPFQMNEQYHKLPAFFQQNQLIHGPMVSFPGTNSGMFQASQTRPGYLPDMPASNHGSDVGPGWS